MKNAQSRPPSFVWVGNVPTLTQKHAQQLRSQSFNEPIGWDPIQQRAYKPACAPGAGKSVLKKPCALFETVWACFEQHILPNIRQHDQREWVAIPSLTVMRLAQGDYIPWHDDLGEKQNADGSIENAAYTCLLYLDEVDGGVFEYIDPIEQTPQQMIPGMGQYIVFSAEVRHRVTRLNSTYRHVVMLRVCI